MALVDVDRPFESVLGVLKVTGAAERTTEIVVIVGPSRRRIDCQPEVGGCFVPVFLLEIQEAELIVAVRAVGIGLDGLLESLSRLFGPPRGPKCLPPVRVGRARRFEVCRLSEPCYRVGMPAV